MKKYIALAVAVIILAGGAFFTQRWFVESFNIDTASQEYASSNITFTATTSGTVLGTMHSLAAEGKFTFSGRDFPGLGFFVEEINGKKNADGYYWILGINGKKSDFGASQARVAPGDIVEWKYEKGY